MTPGEFHIAAAQEFPRSHFGHERSSSTDGFLANHPLGLA
jgi:hypothetical protein